MADIDSIPLRKNADDLSGQRFGRLVAISHQGNRKWLCRCDCGGTSLVVNGNLKRGTTKSCGCIKRQVANIRATKHGLHGTHVWRTWISIRVRCYNPKNISFKYYGARGIKICDQWRDDVAAFAAGVGAPPTPQHTLDRINVDGHYEPGNVRWATSLEQGSNKRNNVRVLFQGKEYTLSQLARFVAQETGLKVKHFKRALISASNSDAV